MKPPTDPGDIPLTWGECAIALIVLLVILMWGLLIGSILVTYLLNPAISLLPK